jgi:peptidoglycan hydrolase-like protein with peptidoglycan-binding domain
MQENYSQYNLKPEFEVLMQESMLFEIGKPKVPKRKRPNYIKWAQTVLNQALGLKLAVDGKIGPQTSSAIRSFQKRSGLAADGIIGKKTEAALIKVNQPLALSLSAVRNVRTDIPKGRPIESVRRLNRDAPNVSEVGIEMDPVSTGVGVITTIFNNEGDIKWELDQMKEPKHPWDDNNWRNAGVWTSQAVDLYVSMDTILGDEISAKFRIRYQYNGHSVGNFLIEVINTEDAAFWGLNVTAKIRPDLNAYDVNGKRPVALVLVNYTYRFDHFYYDDKIYSGELKFYGTGDFTSSGQWTQW